MVRLRQQYPQNYGSSGNISTEFENLTRYINAAELGDNTVGELLSKLFDAAGNWSGPIEMRLDASSGLQYRVGTYTDASLGWINLATLASIKGADGSTAGTVGAPIFHARQDTTTSGTPTVVDYAHNSTDELVVYREGKLQQPGGGNDYTSSPTAGTGNNGAVTFTGPLTNGDKITIYKVRSSAITGYVRQDTTVSGTATQAFIFTHTEDQELQVW